MRPLSELKLWPQNYHEGDVGAIIASIEKFGFNGALRVHGDIVVAGNHALKALNILRDRGATAPVNIVVVGDEWLVPTISVDHLTKIEAEAFASLTIEHRPLAATILASCPTYCRAFSSK